jgi:hypothetical protein
MEMRRRMIAVVHGDDDAQKATELRHASNLTSYCITPRPTAGRQVGER